MIEQANSENSQLYPVSQPLVFKGHFILRVLRGTINVGGVTLNASMDEIPVSCPSAPYFSIKPQFSISLGDFVPNNLKSHYENVPCIIEVFRPRLTHIAALAPPFKSLFEPLQQLSSATDPTLLWIPFSSWTTTAQSLQLDDRLVLVGPKNSGKSSLARYIANLKLPVYLLDLDPGQCEFTPPGTMSLAKITRPDFSAPYLRCGFENNVILSHTLGYVTPIDTPGRYLAICNQLLQAYPGDAPLVVNTPGWTKGLGLELVLEIICMVNASKAVHMGQDESYESLQESLLERLNLKVDICEPVESNGASKFSASDLRNLQAICYFNKTEPLHVTQWAPYELQFDPNNADGSAIAGVAVLDSDCIDPADYSLCIEGTLVSINQLDSNVPIERTQATSIPFLPPHVASSLHQTSHTIGYALVQKTIENGVRLLTPLNPEKITGPIILVRGRLDVPLYLLWDQEASDAPWLISKNPPGVGSVYTKFRRNIGRN